MFRNKDKFFALGAEAMRSLSRFALGIALARWVGPDAYGTFVLMMTAEIILHTICTSLWATPMASIAPGREEPDRSRLIRTAMSRHVRGSVISGVVTLALCPWFLGRGVTALQAGAYVLAVVLCGVLNGERARVASTFRSQAALAADAWATWTPVVAVGAGLALGADVILVYWASRAFSAWLTCTLLRRRVPMAGEPGPTDTSRLELMGRQMMLGSIAYSLCTRVQPFVLASFATPLQLGLFGAASALTGPLRMATAALSGVLRPRLALHFGSETGTRKGWRTAGIALGAAYGFGLVAVLGAALLGSWAAGLLFGSQYPGLGIVLVVAMIFAAAASGNALLMVVIQIVDSAATTAKMRVAVGALALASVGPCVLFWGATGAFASLVIAEATYALIGAVVLGRKWRADQGKISVPAEAKGEREDAPEDSAEGRSAA